MQYAGRGQRVYPLRAATLLPGRPSLPGRAATARYGANLRDSRRCGGPNARVEKVPDDRDNLQPDDAPLLIVEDDPHYARALVDLAHDHGFKVLVAARGAEGLELVRKFRPGGSLAGHFLPDMLGWTVLSQLKQDPATRHIPVQIITLDEDRQDGLSRGAFGFLTKPATTEGLQAALSRIKEYAAPRRKRLLVVEDACRRAVEHNGVRPDRSLERSQGGLGIGLTLVRRLVEMHGGIVEVHSAGINQGSEFIVRLPVLAESAMSALTQEPTDIASQPATTRRVLVVDDNHDSAESLALLRQLTGYEVKMAHDGLEAVEASVKPPAPGGAARYRYAEFERL